MNNPLNLRDQLIEKGCCVAPQLMSADLLERVRKTSERLLDENSAEERKRRGHQGNVVSLNYQDPVFSELIALPAALEVLAGLGFDDPRYFGGAIIAKEGGSPPLYWHQDWTYWEEPESADPVPHQVFLMWYLSNTNRENGCLRVVPGSHNKRLEAHDLIGTHDDGVRHQDPKTSSGYKPLPGEVDLPVTAGDLVIGDARLLHAAHANQTSERRTVITLWYVPRYNELSERVRAGYQKQLRPMPDTIDNDERDMLSSVLVDYSGTAEPARQTYDVSDLLPRA
ncbi:MAG: phytanoyl-CoA dioxygenase family protein [Boseongicola sp.]|nr:phytanoyl-CoA dioxygenase family protein [Boseongicola sp.]